MEMKKFYQEYLNEFKDTLDLLDVSYIEKLHKELSNTINKSSSVYVLGNGGSAASASHWVCDFNKGINTEKSERLRLFSLSDNTPLFSALGNDVSYEDVFLEQLKNLIGKDDLVIGLSVSGNSENIVKALEYAQENEAKTFSIIGDYSGEMEKVSDSTIIVPSRNYGIVEDIHMFICHVISQFMYQENKEIMEVK